MKRRNLDQESSEPRRIKSPPNMADADEIHNLISFNPSSSSNLSAEEWIEKIECLRPIYEWDDRKTLSYAILRLHLQAGDKNWLRENLCNNWSEFKAKFLRRFSKRHSTSKTEYFERLKHRNKKVDESFEDYVKDVQRISRKCDCSTDDTIIYIILGLEDSFMRSELYSFKCQSVDELLLHLKKITSSVVKKKHDSKKNESDRSVNVEFEIALDETEERPPRRNLHLRQTSTESVINNKVMCTKCGKFGHDATDCFFNDRNFCSVCGKKGHQSRNCPSNKNKEVHEKRNSEHLVNTRVYCTICEMRGHHTKHCRYKNGSFHRNRSEDVRTDTEDRNMRCFNCRKFGHYSVNCPQTIIEDIPKFQHSPKERINGEGNKSTHNNSDRSRTAPAFKEISQIESKSSVDEDEHDFTELFDLIKREPE